METKVKSNQIFCCGQDTHPCIFKSFYYGTIVELFLSVFFNIGFSIVVGFFVDWKLDHEVGNWSPVQIYSLNLACITTNTIFLIFELQKFVSIEKWNFVMRIIWTTGLGKNQ